MIKVVCGVISNGDKYLITKRGDKKYYGQWEFPGGKVLNNESLFEAIKREVLEELKIQITPQAEITRYNYGKFYLIFIQCGFNGLEDSVNLTEHLEYKWVSKEEINENNFIDGDIKFVKTFISKE